MQDEHDVKRLGNEGVSIRTIEIAAAAIIFLIGTVVIYDSQRVGASWASDGPQAGYFPFYIGTILCLASAWILAQALWSGRAGVGAFVSPGRFRLVLAVLVPAVLYVAAIYFIGIYVASALFIAGFMGWQGKFGPTRFIPVSLVVPAIMFVLFEIWFLVPLPKGPVEALFGY